jgi:hypothetical protein
MREMRKSYKILVGKPEGHRPPQRPRHISEDNTRTVLEEIGWERVDWMHTDQDRDQRQALVNTVMNLWLS